MRKWERKKEKSTKKFKKWIEGTDMRGSEWSETRSMEKTILAT